MDAPAADFQFLEKGRKGTEMFGGIEDSMPGCPDDKEFEPADVGGRQRRRVVEVAGVFVLL